MITMVFSSGCDSYLFVSRMLPVLTGSYRRLGTILTGSYRRLGIQFLLRLLRPLRLLHYPISSDLRMIR